MRKGWRIFLLVVLVFCWSGAVCLAGTVVASGTGATERSALQDAMRAAVEQEAGVVLDAQTIVQNFQTLKDRIYVHSDGYITSYEVLSGGQENGLYTVHIRAVVSEQLQTDLLTAVQRRALIGLHLDDPRIGVLAVDADGNEVRAAEDRFTAGLSQQGFSRLVDLQQLTEAVRLHMAEAAFQGQSETLQALASEYPVDYLLVVRAEQLGGLQGSRSDGEPPRNAQVEMSARLFNMNTGEILFADTVQAVGLHPNVRAAQAAAVQNGVGKLLPKLSKALMERAASPSQHIQLFVTTGVLGDLAAAQQYLGELPGVNAVFVRSVQNGQLLFDLDYCGTAADLAELLQGRQIGILALDAAYIKI